MPPAAPARLALALGLGLGLWLGALAGGLGRGCGPCAPPCLCGPAPGAACRANCSGRGLRSLGPALRIPADATALDASHNLLSELDAGLLANLSELTELDISHNKISTLEEGIFANLFNLSEIHLGGNPLECDCALAWLPRWLSERNIHLVGPEVATCGGPGPLAGQPLLELPWLDHACGEEFVACLRDNSSDALVLAAFSAAPEEPAVPETCGAMCFAAGQRLAAFSEQGQCLCGAAWPQNASSACLDLCSGPLSPGPPCGGPTLLQHPFPASPGASLVGPPRPLASGQLADFHVTALLPVSTTRWHFGDGTPEVGTVGPAISHHYMLPGRYQVTVLLALGAGTTQLAAEVQVYAAPSALELECAPSVHSGEPLELQVRNRGGSGLQVTYNILAVSEEPARVVHPLCPPDTIIFPGNGHCYRLVATKASWWEAQDLCHAWAGAALATVDSDAVQHFLISQVTRSLDVWIGFSAVSGTEPGPGDRPFSLESCQNWLPGEPHPASAERCVRLGPAGQCNTDLCSVPHSYVCELRPAGPVQDAKNLLIGAPSGEMQGPLSPLAQQEALSAPQELVEVMLFPCLGLGLHPGTFLTVAELATQGLSRPVQLRLQVYRTMGAAGTPGNSSEPTSSPSDNGTQLGPVCVPKGGQCPDAYIAQTCANGSLPELGFLGANFVLWTELLLSVPAGSPAQYTVAFQNQDGPLLPGDLLVLQHDAGPGSFLLCPPEPGLLGTQTSYFSTNSSSWLIHLPTQLEMAPARPACALRLLAATEQLTPLLGTSPNPGLPRPGHYEVRATVGNGVWTNNLTCSFDVVSPVAGLRVVHPIPQDGRLYVPTNSSTLVLQVDAGTNATATVRWSGGNASAPFQARCPSADVALVSGCAPEAGSTLFSVLALPGLSVGEHVLEVLVESSAGRETQSLSVWVEEPVQGLHATPNPEARVLQGVLVRYSPVVEAGSNVTFRWTIDDKQSLTFHNVVFNVIYQSAAIFKLSLTASNHVSNVTVHYNVTVERMHKMQDLQMWAEPTVLPPNTSLALGARVLVDLAVEVTFVWTFGDGEQVINQFKPPYNESCHVPDPTVAQVLLEHNISHSYAAPGEYNLTLLVSNDYENLTRQLPVSVRATLSSVAVTVDSPVLVAGRPAAFSAQPLPLSEGILYTWDFGDGSPAVTQLQPDANHIFAANGSYRVHLEVSNGIGREVAWADVRVYEELRGLHVLASPTVEQGAPMQVNASLESGDAVMWTFDMGDGTVLSGPQAVVEHTYQRAQNCVLTVVAASPAGRLSHSLPVRVFVLEVLRIEPAACIPMQPSAQLTAYVTGDPAHYIFDWTFGDGSSNSTVRGDPSVTHNFTHSGTFPLTLVLSSHVNKAHYFTRMCVEPELANVTLWPNRQFVRLGDEAHLEARAWPPFPYRFTWDFGTPDTSSRVGGSEATFAYPAPGSYLVMVTVANNVSSANGSALVEVQEPVQLTGIQVNGSSVLELQRPYLLSVVGRGHPATYLWHLGDGGQLEGPSVVHAYNSTGCFTITVAGWNAVSRAEAMLNVTVQARVRGLRVSASRTVVPLNGSVSFSTTLEAGSNLRYSWVLCDRCTPIPSGPTISYTFRSVGTFNVIVTAENDVGSAQDSIFISVLQPIEGLQVTGGRGIVPTNHTLQLLANVAEGTNISYSWTAQRPGGPTLAGSGKTFSLTVLEPGTYHVQLCATNLLGSVSTNCTVEFMEPVGQLVVSASPNPAALNQSVSLAARLAGGSSVLYTWGLEGELSWETEDPATTCVFPAPGLHWVTVTAHNRLGSTNATVLVSVQVPVGGLKLRASEPNGSFVASGSTVSFWGQLTSGTNVSWSWAVPSGSKYGQQVSVLFPEAGTVSVHLNVSNAVSWASATHSLTVQDPVVGLVLWTSRKVVEPGQLVHFQALLAAGSAVSFRLQISGSSPEALPGPHFVHTFSLVGDYVVSVQAENQVSRVQAQVRISVLDAVAGLQVPNCCEASMATGTERNFTARVQKGSQVAYAWYFLLQKVQGDSLVILSGREVTYTPMAAGLLEIQVRAFNDLGGVNLTLRLEVQDIIQHVALHSSRCFTNRSARFEANTSPSSRHVAYHWDFGDGAPEQDTEVPWAEHAYLQPGDYRMQVNASNLVSFFVVQVTVTVFVLACPEPEVDVTLPAQVLMRRSQRNYLEARVDLRGCVTYQTEYHWQVFRAAHCQRPPQAAPMALRGVDTNRPQLVLPRLALPVGHYCFVFVVSFGDTPLARSIQANVTVVAERLVPIIEGGSYRVWSDTHDLLLDGSKSYDPNLEDGDQTPLSFHWACVASTQIGGGGGCALSFGPRGSSVVRVPRERLRAGVEYTFNLTVWKAGRKEEATTQTVLIQSGQVPIVSLECVSCKAQAVYAVSHSSYVYLEGRCDSCSGGPKQGRWAARTFSNKTLVLNSSSTSTGSSELRLVVRRGVLRDGEGYIFTLTVLDQDGEAEGYASIRLAANRPPHGGSCRLFPLEKLRGLTAKVNFECSGWQDAEDPSAPLVYALLLRRCREGHCEEFCIYKGSLATYGAVLPPGFAPRFLVDLAVVVQDQLGAAVVALNRSLVIILPEPPDDALGLTPWLHNLTGSTLPGLLKQADPQHVIEFSLALITVLNEYEESLTLATEPEHQWQLRAQIRGNITEALVSLRVDTVDDTQQIAAALAQCTVSGHHLVCRSCLKRTLQKLEAMMSVLQAETAAGTGTPIAIADSILNITGDLIHLASTDMQAPQPPELGAELPTPSLMVASQAYRLSSALMGILMRSRVVNEEPLTLAGTEIVAQGKRSDTQNLLCCGASPEPGCHFSIPTAFSGALANLSDVVQLILLVDSNPFPFGFIGNYTVSTKVASMAFQTQAGTHIPIGHLASERAIVVKVPSTSDPAALDQHNSATSAIVPPGTSVSAMVVPESSNPEAGLHLRLTYELLNEHQLPEEPEPYLAAYLHSAPGPNEHNCSARRRISPGELRGEDHRPYTFFMAPGTRVPGEHYYLNLTSHFRHTELRVSLSLYMSLCQYFSEEKMMWSTDGLVPLEETSPSQAVCLTRHLTAFGASLLVPPSRVHFTLPEPAPATSYVVLLTCAVCLATYAIMAAILRRLDQLDVRRVRVTPFCGQGGRFKYEILVKTGWGRGSGTTAHVGIMLYGADSRSGHRHLDGFQAFHRNSLDIFQIATPQSLGSLWKIRVWHDNKGLSPAWFLQHIIVRDLQSARSTFFLVNDWLTVDAEANGGLVEKEVLAASDAALRHFRRLLVAELQRGLCDKHIWLSIWDRPARSRFTRVQRATCCVLLLCLFLGANALWYGAVGDTAYGARPVSNLTPLGPETVAVGLLSSVVVYPAYLLILFLFRMSRSKVAGVPRPLPAGQQVLDVDSYLDSSVLDTSFLSFPGLQTEAFATQARSRFFLDDSESAVCWPDLLRGSSTASSSLQQPGSGPPNTEGLALTGPPAPAKYFSASDEDSHGQNLTPPQDVPQDSALLPSLCCMPGVPMEPEELPQTGPALAQCPHSQSGLAEGLRKRLLPAWCAPLAHGLSLLLVAVAVAVSGWLGAGFPPHVNLMWLMSSSCSFLASFLGWEPLKVLLEALYFSLVAKRLHPDEDDTLVECPAVTPVNERVPRVRPPHGFALFLAKEEARKVKRLHRMLRSLLVYMLFLLVALLANYGDAASHGHAFRLQSAIKQELDSHAFLAITRSQDFWPWMSQVLLPFVHSNQSSPELGPPRLRQVRLQEAICSQPPGTELGSCSAASSGFSTQDYGLGWGTAAPNSSETWAYSPPDLLGVWYWGHCAVYDSGGYIQELGLSLQESLARLHFLQLHNWIDNRSRAVFVELTRYSPAVGLHAAVTLRLEFPASGRAVTALSVSPFALRRLSSGLSLPLLTSVILLLFALYFSVTEVRAWRREGRARWARPVAWARWLLVALTATTALVRLAQLGAADLQWTRFVRLRPRRFTSFDQVAQLSASARGLAASLLFLILVKAAQQLRFVRQWSVFGKTLCHALPELAGVALGLVVLAAAYTQLSVLLVSSCVDSLRSAAQALLVLCPGIGMPAQLCPTEPWRLCPLLCTGLWALRLWGALRLGAVLLRWRYRALRGDLYRPAWEPQDYEMVELFLRRLRLWMGFSKVKEFRHRVRFEGVEPLPSCSSRGSKLPQDEPLPSRGSGGSDTSRPSTASSQLDGLSLGRPGPRVEPEPSCLQAVFEALLAQFDRLNQATEDVYQLEQQLQGLQGRRGTASLPPGLRPTLPSRPTPGPSKASFWTKNKVHPSST